MTRLCVGAVSRNVVAAAVEEANAQGVGIDIIASRRQVDTDGGYLRWTQADLVRAVETWDDRKLVRVCRDHGGPHQRERVAQHDAIHEALESFNADWRAGFQGLHIDVCESELPPLAAAEQVETFVELLTDMGVTLEVGSEHQGDDPHQSAAITRSMLQLLNEHDLLRDVRYAVVQTGTRVVEMHNVVRSDYAELTARAIRLCDGYGVALKEHNGDYLTEAQLVERKQLGVPALNIAPEYGVIETLAFLSLCNDRGRVGIAQRFIEIALAAGKWQKWLEPMSTLDSYERAVLGGHYVFEYDEVHELKDALGPDTDEELIELVRLRIRRHLEVLT